MKYNDFNLGQIEAVFNKLGGPHGVNRFLRDDTFVQAKLREFKVWRTIKVGNYDMGELIDEVLFGEKFERRETSSRKSEVYGIRSRCIEMLHSDEFKMYPAECGEIDLVIASPSQLGFKDGASDDEVYSWANELGLKLCLPEVGIQLCLQPEDRPTRGLVNIAMKSISLEGKGGFPYVYKVGMSEGLLLDWDSGNYIYGTTSLVFHLPRKIN